MSITAKSNLSFDEIKQLEAQLLARGFRQTSTYPTQMETHEYSVNTLDEPRPAMHRPSMSKRYSICWRS